MKFSIQREVLLKPLLPVASVVEKRQTLPVLSNLLISVDEEGIQLTGTDLEVELVGRAALASPVVGESTMPAKKLADLCRSLPDGSMINVEVKGEKATLRAGRSRFTLATLPVTEFPALEEMDLGQKVTLSQGALKKIIDSTAFAMAYQDVRYYLNGLLLELSSGLVRTVATDGHRLACCDLRTEIELLEGPKQLIIPRKGVVELQRILEDSDEPVTLELGKNHLRVSCPGMTMTSKLIDGRFPDYEGVVPIGADRIAKVAREPLIEALKRAAILSNEKYRGVRLELEQDQMRIVAHNPEQEEAVEELEVEYNSEPLAVGFNFSYLLEALSALSGDEVLLHVKDGHTSCLLKEIDDDNSRHVVMPLRL